MRKMSETYRPGFFSRTAEDGEPVRRAGGVKRSPAQRKGRGRSAGKDNGFGIGPDRKSPDRKSPGGSERQERSERFERPDRPERPERFERSDRQERQSRAGQSGQPERSSERTPKLPGGGGRTVRIGNLVIGEGMPKICVPVVGKNVDEMLRQAGRIMRTPADLVEWRADYFRRVEEKSAVLSAARKLAARLEGKPVLFTFRTSAEGGERELAPEKYLRLYENVIRSGCVDAVDIEYSLERSVTRRLIDLARRHGVAVILSYHDFAATPSEGEIVSRLETMKYMGADIAKIAVMPQNSRDVLSLLAASQRMKEGGQIPVICISMGADGVISRISGEIFGSAVTFASAGKESAPGQLDADEADRFLRSLHRGKLGQKVRLSGRKRANVILIGFMGTGKSTVARKLAKKTGLPVREMDDMIVEQEGMPITKIFERYGETYFRDLETKQAEKISEADGVIVSCGGGTVMRWENVRHLRKNGVIVLLQATPDTVYERVKRGGDKRPLLNKYMSRGYISWLMKQRDDIYREAADVIIETDGMSSERVAEEIMRILEL